MNISVLTVTGPMPLSGSKSKDLYSVGTEEEIEYFQNDVQGSKDT